MIFKGIISTCLCKLSKAFLNTFKIMRAQMLTRVRAGSVKGVIVYLCCGDQDELKVTDNLSTRSS